MTRENGEWEKVPAVLESLKYRNFRYFWSAQLFSLIGVWMQMIAMGWLVYEMTGSKFLLGLINTISGLPVLFLTPVGGYISDHFNKRNLMVVTSLCFALISFMIGIFISTGMINFVNLAVFTFLMGVTNAIDSPARQSFVIELINKRSIPNAIALNSLSFNVGRVIGPAVAGYLIGAAGVESCFYINAMSFGLVVLGQLVLTGDFSAKAVNKQGLTSGMLEGLNYVLENRKVLYYLILVAFSSLFIMPYAVMMPVFAKDVFQKGAQGLGILMAFPGFGALLGASILAQFSKTIDIEKNILYSTVTMAAALFIFALSTNFLFSCLMLVFIGWGIVSQAASINTYLQKVVPNELRGRLMAFYVMSFLGVMPIGAFQAGLMAHYSSAQAALAIGAVLSLLPITLKRLLERKA